MGLKLRHSVTRTRTGVGCNGSSVSRALSLLVASYSTMRCSLPVQIHIELNKGVRGHSPIFKQKHSILGLDFDFAYKELI